MNKNTKNWVVIILLTMVTSTVAQTNINFQAKGLVVLSDADMAASTVVDGQLLRESAHRDQLSTLALPLANRGQEAIGAVVSNSAFTTAKGLGVSKDGRLAFVVETYGQFLDTNKVVPNLRNSLPVGNRLYIADIANLNKPRARFGVPTGMKPLTCDVFQQQVLVLCQDSTKFVQFIEADPLGHPSRTFFSTLRWPEGTKPVDIVWQPDGELAVVLFEKSLRIIKPKRGTGNKVVDFEWFGKELAMNEPVTLARFVQQGKFLLIGSVFNQNTKGGLVVVQLNVKDTLAPHKTVSKTSLGQNTQDFAVYNNIVVATNARKSHLPWGQADFLAKGSLSLLTLGQDGALGSAVEYEFEGIMPRGVAFDATGQHIAVAIAEYHDFGKRNGGIEFWKVNTIDNKPTLQKQPVKINVQRGAYAIKAIMP